MPARITLLFLLVLMLAGCATSNMPTSTFESPYASGRKGAAAVQCVPYARQQSGIQIKGDAYTWWENAAPDYDRGHGPRSGAVLVLAKTSKLRHGHLAVVKDILGPRQINVTHSNWGNDRASRRIIYDDMRVEDVSPRNDWTSVRFWNDELDVFGFPYAARGFVYR